MDEKIVLKGITDIGIKIKYEDLDKLEYPKNELIYLIVEYENFDYEFLLRDLDESDKLTVLGSGAFNKEKGYDRTGPWFNRWSWTFDDSTLYYHDPTLYLADDIYGPWGLGTPETWYLEKISIITAKIAEVMGVRNNDILFYGSSAGGFTSLMLSIMVKDSVCLAEVPQFDITSWGSFWRPLKNASFDMDDKEFVEKYGNRVSVMKLIQQKEYIPNAYVMMDCSAEYDFTRQYLPFFKRLNNFKYDIKGNSMKLIIFGKNMGHSALPKDVVLSMIRYVRLNEFYINNPQVNPKMYQQDPSRLVQVCDEYRRKINQLNRENVDKSFEISSLESMLQDNGQEMTCATDEEIPSVLMDKKIQDKNKLISYLNDMVTSFKEEFKRKDAEIDDLTTQLDRLKEDSLSKEKQLNELLKKKDEKIRQLNERLDNQ
ncbi:hypothetical protein [Methanosphaera sp. BMS]|uniref:hypothetical protein n=1 Tax=Methanosphaera sp. BMS TaxID=1789762 RepID=UPI000DC1D1F4|nr:hypothetical protein [Methanosphaera sp. BMS]AWX32567.1 hypothetical protein AW729_05400 [Methanosphaera sp. BMS]